MMTKSPRVTKTKCDHKDILVGYEIEGIDYNETVWIKAICVQCEKVLKRKDLSEFLQSLDGADYERLLK
jgi:hypothetical protein